MEIGSIVVMVKPLHPDDIKYLISHGFKSWPVPSDTVYHMVTGMIDVREFVNQPRVGTGIQIDSYEDMAEANLYFDIDLFAELLPAGDISVSETEKSAQPKVKELELELV